MSRVEFVDSHPSTMGPWMVGHPASVVSLRFFVKKPREPKQILRLTTPKLKDVWGPFRSG